MKRIVLLLLLALLAAPALADRTACTAAITATGVCRQNSDILWSLSISPAADAKLQTALAKKAGWTAQVTCTQAMVPASCTAQQVGQLVANPVTERQAARAEFKRLLKDEYIRSLDAETIRADSKAALDAALAAIGNPDIGN